MSLVPFPSWIQTSQRIFFQFCHVTKCAWWHCPWVTFSVFPITHSAVAAGSRQRRADDACALDQSHSAPSGDAPSASSSHLLFGNRWAAETRNTPVKQVEKNNCHSEAEGIPHLVWKMTVATLKSVQNTNENKIPPNWGASTLPGQLISVSPCGFVSPLSARPHKWTWNFPFYLSAYLSIFPWGAWRWCRSHLPPEWKFSFNTFMWLGARTKKMNLIHREDVLCIRFSWSCFPSMLPGQVDTNTVTTNTNDTNTDTVNKIWFIAFMFLLADARTKQSKTDRLRQTSHSLSRLR